MNRSIGLRAQSGMRRLHGGGRTCADRLEAPVLEPASWNSSCETSPESRRSWPPSGSTCWRATSTPQGAPRLDPLGQGGDLAGGQLRLGRHLVGFAVVDRVDQQALLGVAGHDRRPGRAAGQDGRARVEPQPPLLLGRPVAALAARRQDRPDALLEKLDRGGIRCRARLNLGAGEAGRDFCAGSSLTLVAARRASPLAARLRPPQPSAMTSRSQLPERRDQFIIFGSYTGTRSNTRLLGGISVERG